MSYEKNCPSDVGWLWRSTSSWQPGWEDVVERWEDVVEVVLAWGLRAVQRECRVTFIHAVCARTWGTEDRVGGAHMGPSTDWTDFLCRVMPRTGFRDKRVGPWTETLTGQGCSHPLSFLICRFCRNKLFHYSVISTDFYAMVQNMHRTVSISWCGVRINCITCSSEIADVLPFLHVSGMHQVWAFGCLGPQRTRSSRDLRNSGKSWRVLASLMHSDSRIHSGVWRG